MSDIENIKRFYSDNIFALRAITWVEENGTNHPNSVLMEMFFKPFRNAGGKEAHACYWFKRGVAQKGMHGIL